MRSGRLLAQAKPDDLIKAYNVLVSIYTQVLGKICNFMVKSKELRVHLLIF